MTDIPFNFKANGADRVAADIAAINKALQQNQQSAKTAAIAAKELARGSDQFVKLRVAQALKDQATAAANTAKEFRLLRDAAKQIDDPAARKRALDGIKQLEAATRETIRTQRESAKAAQELARANAQLAQQKSKEALAAQAKAARDKAIADREAAKAAEQLARTNAALTKQRVKEELSAQAKAAREAATAEREAAKAADQLARTNAALTQQRVAEELKKQADAARDLERGFQSLALASGAFAGVIAKTFVDATQAFVDFDRQVRQAGVISGSLGTEEFERLNDEIIRLGIETSKTPQDVAGVSVALSRAGFSATETSQALEGIVRSSEASAESLSVTGDIIAKTIRSFQLGAEDSLRVSDILVATANNTNTSIGGLGESLKFVAPSAVAAGQEFADIAKILGLLGDAGLQGGNAGRNLAAALQQLSIASAASDSELSGLVRGSKRAADALKVIGVSARGADGQLRPITEVFPEIQKQLSQLSEQDQAILIKALFGTEGGRVASNLFNILENAPDRLNKVSEAVDNAAGVSVRSGEQLLQGLPGALDLLEGSLQTAAVKIGEFASVGLEPLARAAIVLVNAFTKLPASIQGVLIATTAFAGALAAAVAAIATYNVLMKQQVIQNTLAAAAEAKNTLVTIANTAAKLAQTAATTKYNSAELLSTAIKAAATARTAALTAAQVGYAVVTRQADAATKAQIASMLAAGKGALAFSASLGAIAGAGVALFAVVDTFNSIKSGADKTRQEIEKLNDVTRRLDELIADSADNEEEAFQKRASLIQKNRREVEQSIGSFNRFLDSVRLALGGGEIGTAANAAVNEQALAFQELAQTIDKDVIGKFEELKNSADGLSGRSAKELAVIEEQLNGYTAALENTVVLSENDAAVKRQQLSILENLKGELKQYQTQVAATTEDVEAQSAAIADNTEELKKQAEELLKEQFDTRQRDEQQGFQDADRIEEQNFQDRQRDIEQAFQDRQREAEEAFQATQQAAEEDFNRRQQASEEAFTARQESEQAAFEAQVQQAESSFSDEERAKEEAFQRTQQAKEREFQAQQQAAERAFQSEQEAARTAAESEFARRQQEIDREIQLRLAEDPDERRRLQEQFEAADREAQLRERLEADLNADRQAFEDAQRSAEEEFQAQQQAQELAFQKETQAAEQVFEQQQQATRLQFESQIQAAQQAFELQQQTAEKAFADQQQAQEAAFQAQQEAVEEAFQIEQRNTERAFQEENRNTERAFQASQRDEERAFQEQQRQAEKAFNEEQRELDQASAEELARIIASARNEPIAPPPTLADAGAGIAGARRDGGAVEAGQVYKVGEAGPELFVSPANGYIIRKSQAEAIARSAYAPAPIAPPRIAAPSAYRGSGRIGKPDPILQQLKGLREDVQRLKIEGGDRHYHSTDGYFRHELRLTR